MIPFLSTKPPREAIMPMTSAGSRASVAIAAAILFLVPSLHAADPRAPETRTVPVVDTLHGITVADPYRWLEDQAAPETRAWIEAQNAYTGAVIGALPGKDRIERRLAELIKIDVVTVPFTRGGRQFYSRRRADQEQAVIYVKNADAAEEVLVDPKTLSADLATSVNVQDVSPDGRLMA